MAIMTTERRLELLLGASAAQLERIDRILPGKPVAEPMIGPLLLNISDAAKYLGVSRSTVYRMVEAGTLDWVAPMGRRHWVRRADIEAVARGKSERRPESESTDD
jgi:excisionase family DNA binding protein